jgi:predicted Rossmann fold flavoprotein
MSRKSDLIIVGGGASGIMAAGIAASKGISVLVFEKMSSPARKLKITGKGRCNITNTAPLAGFLKEIGPDPRFLRNAFSVFFNEELIEFLHSIGIQTIEERGGRVFPQSQDAVEFSSSLIAWALKQGAKIICSAQVVKISAENQKVIGVRLASGEFVEARKVLIATGGKSYPATGSTGDGYALAIGCGHSVIPPRPVLVPLETAGDIAGRLQGLSLKNVAVNVWIDGKKAGSEFGEMLFTHYGLSGPAILTLSRKYAAEMETAKSLVYSIDLKPALDEQKLDQRILRDLDEHGKRYFGNLLRDYLPGKLLAMAPQLIGIDADKPCNQISASERKRFKLWLKDFRFEITGHRGWKEAIITQGGIALKDVNPQTMESKVCSGLYLAGEVLDLDANTGGYNLQLAFSTAYLAGLSAATS